MTSGLPPATILPSSQVEELVQSLVKALRAYQMYLPNNPVYHRATANVRAAFGPIWAALPELVLQVAETDFLWEGQVVYHQLSKGESLAWSLFKDGMRALTFRPGAEQEELPRFLEAVNRARFLPADAGDDLLTLLWEQEFQLIHYQFAEFLAEVGNGPEVSGSYPTAAEDEAIAARRHGEIVEEAPPRPKGVVDLEEFDSTLYFLEEAEVTYIAREVEAEYGRDVRASALDALCDLFELEPDPALRGEILDILEQLFPHLLNARDFRAAAAILRESKALLRAPDLLPEHRARLDGFVLTLSQPAIVAQLVQALDEISVVAGTADATEVLRELRGSALEPIVGLLPNLASASLRGLLGDVAERLASTHPDEVLRLLRQPDSPALAGIVALAGRLGLHQAVPALGETLKHPTPAVRLAAVQALAQLGTPGSLALVDRALEDADRTVRLAAVRAVGLRGYKGALRRVETVVLGKGARGMDLTEKMAFFEAYGAIAGPTALGVLRQLLLPRGLLRRREPAETRACAVIALGKIRIPEARELLERALEDKDLVVRSAVSRALREASA